MEYIFYGHVAPTHKRVRLDVKNPPFKLKVESAVGNFELSLLLNNTSDVVVLVVSEHEIHDIANFASLVKYQIQSLYDTALLQSGVLSTVTFDSLLLPDRRYAQLSNNDISSWLQTNIFEFDTQTLFSFQNNTIIKIAISDLKSACMEPEFTSFFAYRAIEVIMNSFSEDGNENRKNNWTLLRENLNISREFFDTVEDMSKFSRHGDFFEQSILDRKICIYSALIVVQRYMHFILNQKQKLNENNFPKLTKVQDFGIQL